MTEFSFFGELTL